MLTAAVRKHQAKPPAALGTADVQEVTFDPGDIKLLNHQPFILESRFRIKPQFTGNKTQTLHCPACKIQHLQTDGAATNTQGCPQWTEGVLQPQISAGFSRFYSFWMERSINRWIAGEKRAVEGRRRGIPVSGSSNVDGRCFDRKGPKTSLV